jgi:hypothetical protein
MKKLILLIVAVLPAWQAYAQCPEPLGHAYLDVNNVRARMNVGGGNWGDLESNASYEVPKGSGVHSFFSNALWIGAKDEAEQIHVAAMQFRQSGMDFWPGPISADGTVSADVCIENDRIYKLNRWGVDEFRHRFNEVGYVIPTDILEWPATGNPHSATHANAPFIDVNMDGIYNATTGDYPAFIFDGPTDRALHLLGDQCLWWIENDVGNTHTESGADSLGVELHWMAYAYATCDVLNDQTFYRVSATNKGSHNYHETYMAVWADPDLGYAQDDYVGCEVMRNLGYVYNGFAVDGTGGPQQYGAHPPAAGVGVLQGPRAPANDGIDNDRDGEIDEWGEQVMMSRFLYHNNSGQGNPATQDPNTGADFYNYMRGIWKDGAPMCYGQNGHPAGGCDTGVPAAFMFPGTSDPQGFGTGGVPQPTWTEQSSGTVPFDRRFMLSVGPFDFPMQSEKTFHYAALWARDTVSNDPYDSAERLFEVKDYVQAKFEANFDNLECCPPVAQMHLVQPQINQFFFSSITEGDSYLWDFGDGTSSTDRFPPAHYYADNQVHQVRLIVTNACGSDTAIVDAGTIFFGVEEEEHLGFRVFPNPSTDNVTITFEERGVEGTLEVRNLLGQSVYEQEINGEKSIHITAKWPAGNYFLVFRADAYVHVERLTVIE